MIAILVENLDSVIFTIRNQNPSTRIGGDAMG
jgi:hypothetical protein